MSQVLTPKNRLVSKEWLHSNCSVEVYMSKFHYTNRKINTSWRQAIEMLKSTSAEALLQRSWCGLDSFSTHWPFVGCSMDWHALLLLRTTTLQRSTKKGINESSQRTITSTVCITLAHLLTVGLIGCECVHKNFLLTLTSNCNAILTDKRIHECKAGVICTYVQDWTHSLKSLKLQNFARQFTKFTNLLKSLKL